MTETEQTDGGGEREEGGEERERERCVHAEQKLSRAVQRESEQHWHLHFSNYGLIHGSSRKYPLC